jgi:hypothetical protein
MNQRRNPMLEVIDEAEKIKINRGFSQIAWIL